MGPKLVNSCEPEQVGTKEYGKMLKRTKVLEDGRVPAKEAINWKIEEYQRVLNKFEVEGFMGQKRIVESGWGKGAAGQERCLRKKVTSLENTRLCMKEKF